jgi:hypothetical protein
MSTLPLFVHLHVAIRVRPVDLNICTLIFQGDIRGIVERARNGDDYVAFYGVPFAQPPLGELRWQPPRPASGWTEVHH